MKRQTGTSLNQLEGQRQPQKYLISVTKSEQNSLQIHSNQETHIKRETLKESLESSEKSQTNNLFLQAEFPVIQNSRQLIRNPENLQTTPQNDYKHLQIPTMCTSSCEHTPITPITPLTALRNNKNKCLENQKKNAQKTYQQEEDSFIQKLRENHIS